MRPSVQSPRPPESDTPVCLQDLPPSVLLLVATALATPLLKHTFRIPHVYRTSHNSLLAASLTCRALRTACFPLAVQVMRSPGLRPQNIADLGESVRELEAKVDYLLGEGNDPLRGHVRSLDIEIYAKAHPRLVSKLATLFTSLPHLHFVALKLPSYRVFRDGFISDLRAVMGDGSRLMRGVTELCVDARLSWLVEFVPDVRELVLWGWPSDVDRDGGLTAEETRDGWRTFLARLNAQAPNVHEVEVGGLSIYDVNELFASLTNYPLKNLQTLRFLHRKEEHGAVALPNPYIPQRIAQDVDQIWEDTEQEEVISGLSGSVKMTDIVIRKRPLASDGQSSQRKFYKKTARGKVMKVIRERYVRDDISCGIDDCQNCASFTHSDGQAEKLPPTGDLTHSKYPSGHFIVPDTNMDLLESPLFKPPIILLQTVLEEVRHRSLPLHARLKGLVASEDKRMYVFYNEFHAQTAVVRQPDETPNDRNDRGIRLAASWYANHYAHSRPSANARIVLLTDDAENRRRAAKEGIETLSVREYVTGAKDSGALLDLLAAESMEAEGEGEVRGRKRVIFDEYLPQSTLIAGVKSGELYQGYFSANAYNYLEGSVNVSGFSKPILLLGREAMNRSIQGDFVVVELLPESEWKAPADAVIDAECEKRLLAAQRNDNPDDSGSESEGEAVDERERLAARDTAARNPKEKQPTGRVVGVMKRNWRAVVCHIDRSSLSSTSSTALSAQNVFATPVDRALPRIRLRTRQAPTLLGQKILVSLDRWDSHSRYPDGHFVRALGKAESKEAERESLLLEFDVPYRPFGKAILDCLPKEGDKWVVPPKSDTSPEWRDREDLRDLIVCSIDPPNCQDIDDALHARPLPNGNIEAGVHIADVSHFVHADTPMDNEAAARGTTVYLVDKRIDMLPSLLGTNLCSLRPYVERLAFSAIWELTPDADIVNVRFTKSVIASKAAFTYEEAQIRKDDPTMKDELTQSIRLLNSLALKLKAKRMAAGALNLASPEVKIHLDSAESSDPIDVEQKELRETNSLVEEFMLLANVSVARQIQEAFPATAVLRRHLPPPHSNFEKLQDLLMKLKGMTLDVSSSGALADSLDKCVDPAEPAFNTLVRIMATRCMLSAEYFCAGSVSRDTFGHYGLASPIYTHFTSPIRRYADVLAHRQLAASIGYTPLHATLHTKSHVERVMSVINRRHRMAQMAGRASVEFYVGLALKARNLAIQDSQGVVEDAFVIKAFRNGVAVFVSKLGIEGLVTFKEEKEFDPELYAVTLPSPNGNVKVAVFDRVQVKIWVEQDKNTLRGKVKMSLVSPVDSTGM